MSQDKILAPSDKATALAEVEGNIDAAEGAMDVINMTTGFSLEWLPPLEEAWNALNEATRLLKERREEIVKG